MARLTWRQKRLAERYWPLALSLAKPFKARYPDLRDELESAAALALIGCARRYDGRINFATYARHRLVGSMLSVLEVQSRQSGRRPMSLGEFDGLIRERRTPDFRRVDDADDAIRVLAELPDRTRRMLVLLHFHGLSQAQAGAILGVTQSTVSHIRRRAIKQIQSRFEPRHADQIRAVQPPGSQGLAQGQAEGEGDPQTPAA